MKTVYSITKFQKTDEGYNRYDLLFGVVFKDKKEAEKYLMNNETVTKINSNYIDKEKNRYEIFEYELI